MDPEEMFVTHVLLYINNKYLFVGRVNHFFSLNSKWCLATPFRHMRRWEPVIMWWFSTEHGPKTEVHFRLILSHISQGPLKALPTQFPEITTFLTAQWQVLILLKPKMGNQVARSWNSPAPSSFGAFLCIWLIYFCSLTPLKTEPPKHKNYVTLRRWWIL